MHYMYTYVHIYIYIYIFLNRLRTVLSNCVQLIVSVSFVRCAFLHIKSIIPTFSV